ncbi:MAG: hypothetical protein OXC31_18215 [Spirochaetaceae bacterium]|nr:hypothetical protein [Spirochaetaceae bacterium]
MNWNEALPDVNRWRPQSKKRDTLSAALMITCQIAQKRVVARVEAERRFNIQNFDSGSAVEDIVREELTNLLPQRYSVDAGVIDDRNGNNAGDCDMIIRDHAWSPVIKPGATSQSRRFHFPIEAVYASIEIKQTMGYAQLDKAMEKLVALARLDRPDNPYGHITENQHITSLDKPGMILNPLHTTVFAVRLDEGVTFESAVRRFGAINKALGRDDMVTCLCVLDHGNAWYSVATGHPFNADFMRDRNQSLVLQLNDHEPDNAFYRWYVLLIGHLTRSVLSLTSIPSDYGEPPPHRTVLCYPDAAFNKS